MSVNTIKHILFCNCKGERIDQGLLYDAAELVKNSGSEVVIVNDLCGVIAEKKDEFSRLFSREGDYLIIGCYRRSMDLLINQATKAPDYEHINLIESSIEEVTAKVKAFTGKQGNGSISEISQSSDWPSWYPVIDYSRCSNCGQCADFCLFSVYERTEGRITVANPKGCKNNCPACARICPSAAIIFPKYKNGGAVGGSDDVDEAGEQQRLLQDIENILGDNIYEALQKRKAKRQSIIREEAMKKACEERDNALKGKTD